MKNIRNILIAAAAGLALVAGQAAATASNHSVVDRVGTSVTEEDDRTIPIALTALAVGIVLMVLVNGSQGDDSESD